MTLPSPLVPRTHAEARARFPVLEHVAYLNAGSMGPLSRATAEAVAAGTQADLERGRGGEPYMDSMNALRDRVRAQLAGLLGVNAEQMALASSTTNACQIVLSGLDLGPEDEVVTTDAEHPGLLAPLHATGARVRVAPVSARPAADAAETILAEVGPRTRLLALSHVTWTKGQVIPVHELRRATRLPLLVDGAQSVGAIPVDARGIDFYTVSCQKWLCGPDPLGGLYVADTDALRIALPTYFSQDAIEPDGSFTPKPGARRFDSGWLPPPSLAGLEVALEEAPEWRFERAAEMAALCRQRIASRFEAVTEPDQATLVAWRCDGDPAAAVARCYDAGVVIRALPRTNVLRASCGYWTNGEDLDRLLAALPA